MTRSVAARAGHRRYRLSYLVLGATLLLGPGAVRSQEWRLILKDLRPHAGEVPVVVEVPPSVAPGSYVATKPGGSQAIAAQVFEDLGKTWLASVLPSDAVDGTFRL